MSLEALTHDELVDDRALKSPSDDAFGHTDFVSELAGLAVTVPTPANIALYGPWGSGKSGLAHLLERQLKDDKRVEFVRFDALKYGEAPLRRLFLTRLSEELGVKTRDLYDSKTTNEVDLPKEKVWTLLKTFGWALAGLMAAVFVISIIYALVAKGATSDSFDDALAWLAPKAFVPAVLLGAIASLMGNQFKVERKVEAPKSDEEFEDAFRELVEAAIGQQSLKSPTKRVIDEHKKRLVVFIDELDRCSPAEVASVLETLRTFLEVEGCVFIVAADQQALEEALSRKVRQATPANKSTPYYSAGSAYLDKIFQYQLSLPPLKPQRLTSFALGLVESKPGVWKRIGEVSDLSDVMSVLIPTHVDSPRRVKALLNNFALLYRVAELRAARGQLAPSVPSRAVEIAKLACLRFEFPLFAADLTLDGRMPDLVHRLSADPPAALPPTLRPEVSQRAHDWANKKLAVDELIANESAGSGTSQNLDGVRAEHATQLLRYLQKTVAVPGPGRDLIHLESAGATLKGLDAAVADDLERAAVDGELAEVKDIVRAQEGQGQASAISLLAHIVRHSAVGVEGANAIKALLSALPVLTVGLGPVADDASRAIASHSYELTDDDLRGALALSAQSSHVAGRELRAKVLAADAVLQEPKLQAAAVWLAADLLDEAPDRLGEVVARSLADENRAVIEPLVGLDTEIALRVLDVSGPAIHGYIDSIEEAGGDSEDAYGHLADGLDQVLAGEDREVGERYAAMLLNLSSDLADAIVRERNEALSDSSDAQLTSLAVERVSEQPADEIADWLAIPRVTGLADEVVTGLRAAIRAQVNGMWLAYASGESDVAGVEALAQALRRYRDGGLMPEAFELDEDTRSQLSSTVSTTGSLAQRLAQFEIAKQYVALGLFEKSMLSEMALETVRVSVNGGNPHIQALKEDLLTLVSEYHGDAPRLKVAELRDHLAVNPVWPGASERWVVELSAALPESAEYDNSLPYDEEQIHALASQTEFLPGLVVWIRSYTQTSSELVHVLETLLPANPSGDLDRAVRRQVEWWYTQGRPSEHELFLKALLSGVITSDTSRGWLDSAGLDRARPFVVDQLGSLYAANKSPQQARNILDVWSRMGVRDIAIQRAFCKHVLVPLAKERDEDSYNVVKDNLKLLKDVPADRRQAVRDALRANAKRFGVADSLEQALDDAGLKRGKRPFGLGGKQDV